MRVGSVGYATEQGLGHLMKWFYDEQIITDVLLVTHSRHKAQPQWYPPDTQFINPRSITGPAVDEFLSKVGVVLFFETCYDWGFPALCRARGVKTVMVPMCEWYPERPRAVFDKVICPSLLDQHYFPGSPFLQVPVPRAIRWRRRERAFRYLHNAGHVGHREHKGTRQLLEALRHCERPLSLTVRCQYDGPVRDMAESSGVYGDSRLFLEHGGVPYGELFASHDVYVAPEKLNGLSLPLLEAYASGMLVITTDRFPANAWLRPAEALVPPSATEMVRVGSNCFKVEECTVDPRALASVMDRWYDRELGAYSDAAGAWAAENSWDVLGPKWREEIYNA